MIHNYKKHSEWLIMTPRHQSILNQRFKERIQEFNSANGSNIGSPDLLFWGQDCMARTNKAMTEPLPRLHGGSSALARSWDAATTERPATSIVEPYSLLYVPTIRNRTHISYTRTLRSIHLDLP